MSSRPSRSLALLALLLGLPRASAGQGPGGERFEGSYALSCAGAELRLSLRASAQIEGSLRVLEQGFVVQLSCQGEPARSGEELRAELFLQCEAAGLSSACGPLADVLALNLEVWEASILWRIPTELRFVAGERSSLDMTRLGVHQLPSGDSLSWSYLIEPATGGFAAQETLLLEGLASPSAACASVATGAVSGALEGEGLSARLALSQRLSCLWSLPEGSASASIEVGLVSLLVGERR